MITINNLRELQPYKQQLSQIKIWVCNTACGKSYLCDIDDRFYDLDMYRSYLHGKGVENFDDMTIPKMYEVLGGGGRQIVLNAAHGHFLNYLHTNNIPFVYIYSKPECQEEYIQRMLHRGSGEDFVQRFGIFIADHYKNRVEDDRATIKIEMNSGEYVADYAWEVFGVPSKYIQNPLNKFKAKSFNTVFCDLDGTLLNREKQVTEYSKKVLMLLSKSKNIILVSARSRERMLPILKTLKLDKNSYYITFNGSKIYKGDKVIKDNFIDGKNVTKIIKCLQNDILEKCYLYTDTDRFTVSQIANLKEFLSLNVIYKVVIVSTAEDITNLRRNLKDEVEPFVDISQDEDTRLTFTKKGVNKGVSVKYVMDALGATRESIIVFGDAENDLPMLDLANTSVAMCNADKNVKQKCRYITDGYNDDGVAKALVKIFNLTI